MTIRLATLTTASADTDERRARSRRLGFVAGGREERRALEPPGSPTIASPMARRPATALRDMSYGKRQRATASSTVSERVYDESGLCQGVLNGRGDGCCSEPWGRLARARLS